MKREVRLYFKDSIIEQLEIAGLNRRKIDVSEVRSIGKTTALVDFAKRHGFTVIVRHGYLADFLIEKTGYQKIVPLIGVKGGSGYFVHDECVSESDIEGLDNVVTGFVSREY